MADQSFEKTIAAQIQHLETNKDARDSRDFIELAEGVSYGYSGARAFLTSPYVFGAALLASMGGFSYGYGVFSPKTWSLTLANVAHRPGSHLAHPCDGSVSLAVPGG